MKLDVKVDARGLLAAFRKFPEATIREIRKEMGTQMEEVKDEAGNVHRFITRSGNLVRSIIAKVSPSGMTGRVFLDDGVARYGKYVHQGFKKWAPDQFLFGAFKRQENKIVQKLNMAIGRAIRKAGLK